MAQMTIAARTDPGIIGHRLITKKAFWIHVVMLDAPAGCSEAPSESAVLALEMFIRYEYLILGSTNAYIRSRVSTTTA